MTWHAVYRKSDGGLVSTGSVLSESLDRSLAVVELGKQPEWDKDDWNPALRVLIPKPPKPPAVPDVDRVEDILQKHDAALRKLTTAERDALSADMALVAESGRWRPAEETP